MTRLGLLWLALIGAVWLVEGCYNHNTPNVNCAADPYQEGCYPPVHDKPKPDGGTSK